MLLVVDIGNTETELGLFPLREDGTAAVVLTAQWRISTSQQQTIDEYGVLIRQLFATHGLELTAVRGIIVASVVPPLESLVRLMCDRYFGIKALFIEPGIKTGMPVHYDNPAEVGADRIVNAVAAYEKCKLSCVVVDFGTATTFDAVSAKGEYMGGVIAPGVNLSLEALHQAAARLPRIGIGRPQSVIGTSTVPAMQSGVYWGYVGLIEGLIARIKAEYGGPMKVVATGGLAPLFAEGTLEIQHIEPDLTLDGLTMLAERNPAPVMPRERTRLIESE